MPTTTKMKLFALAASTAMIAAVPAIGLFGGTAQAIGNTRNVSTTGVDSGNCRTSPCATINYAIGQALPGDTVKVAAGTYNQQVNVNKPVQLLGAGALSTTIDGQGLDGQPSPGYGVVYVGTTGGSTTVSGFTITNPMPYAYTSGEPMIVGLADPNSSDIVTITKNIIKEGTLDPNASSDGPIGIDSFVNNAQTVISSNTIDGTFQGALFEDNGPISFKSNIVQNLIANAPYPAEGVFFLSDTSGSLTGQSATLNTFKSYSGYGVIAEAGYNNGNCTANPCNGSMSGDFSFNNFALTGGSTTVGIVLESRNPGNDLTATSSGNHGYVTFPSQATAEKAISGGTLSVSGSTNSITVHLGPVGSASTRIGPLHDRGVLFAR